MEETHLKVLVVGTGGVGKTCLVKRFIADEYSENFFGFIEEQTKDIIVYNRTVKLSIYDSKTMEKRRPPEESYFRGVHGYLVLYDETDLESYNALETWLNAINRFKPSNQETVTMLVGCKTDDFEKKIVDYNKVEDYATERGVTLMLTSAKNNINVTEVFTEITKAILKARNLVNEPAETSRRGIRAALKSFLTD